MASKRYALKGLPEAIKRAGMSYQDLSRKLGYTYPTLYRKRTGDLSTSLDDLKAMAGILGCSMQELAEGFTNFPQSTGAVSKPS